MNILGSVTLIKEIENEYMQLENEVKKLYIILILISLAIKSTEIGSIKDKMSFQLKV
jgi:hypothetical protein